MSVSPRGISVQTAYQDYRAGAFRVNRRYQRKLVWTLDEKRQLIDSILHGYPIPLILLATRQTTDGSKEYEILDGMQRLNAVFSFIENRFSVGEKFFDVEQLSRAKQAAKDEGFTVETEPTKLLTADSCAAFLDYNFAVTEFPAANDSAVNEVFGRINAYGRQLSQQEQRQAGIVSSFAGTIRDLAAEVRGDVSQESLDLAEMPSISIDVGGEHTEYGVTADDTFWCKQGILRKEQLRESEDEQLLADLAVSIVQGEPFAFSGDKLDAIYAESIDPASDIAKALSAYGTDALKYDLISTISILRDTIEDYDDQPNALRKLVNPGAGSNPIKTAFYSIFMAFFELCVGAQKSPTDSKKIMAALSKVHDRLNVARGQIRADSRRSNIDVCKGLIQAFFEDKVPPAVQTGSGLAIRFENSIRRSKIETAAFECKQGILRLDATRSEDPNILDELLRTTCAISNIGPKTDGAIFIGVADSVSDKNRIEQLDSVKALDIAQRFVVGIDREAPILGISLDDYKMKIVNHFSSSGLSEPLKTAVLGSMDCITYRSVSVLCIWIPAQSKVSTLDDAIYVREGSQTKQVSGVSKIQAVIDIFQ